MNRRADNMLAAVLTGHGGPDRIRLDPAFPRPRPGPDEVLIRVGAAGINNTDIWSREGAYSSEPDRPEGWRGAPLKFPRIQGGDVAGRITAVGAGVEQSLVGERVLVNSLLYADGEDLLDAGLLGSERDGGFAEYVAVPRANAHPIRVDLTDAELATFPIAYLTALHMLNRARLAAGETVLITGVAGGVGTALVELAVARGARVIAMTRAEKFGYAEELGASICIDREDQRLAETLRAVGGVEVVADVVGGDLFAPLLDSLRPGGRYVTAGAIAGPQVELDLRTLYLRHLELIGSTMGTQQEFARLVDMIERGHLCPRLAATFPLSEIHQAQQAFVDKAFTGKLVLVREASA